MRQRILTVSIALALLVMSFGAAAAQKTDFSGTWELDMSRSDGLPPGMKQTMTVKQVGDRVDMEMKVSGPRGDEEIKEQFTLDGKETDYTPLVASGIEVKRARRTPKWTADGKGFELFEDTIVDGPDGTLNIKVTRHWQLSEDGKTLTIDVAIEGPRGVRKFRRVYARK